MPRPTLNVGAIDKVVDSKNWHTLPSLTAVMGCPSSTAAFRGRDLPKVKIGRYYLYYYKPQTRPSYLLSMHELAEERGCSYMKMVGLIGKYKAHPTRFMWRKYYDIRTLAVRNALERQVSPATRLHEERKRKLQRMAKIDRLYTKYEIGKKLGLPNRFFDRQTVKQTVWGKYLKLKCHHKMIHIPAKYKVVI